MYTFDYKYSILSLIFRTLSLIILIISLFLFLFDIRIVYKGIILFICSIPLVFSILSLIFEHLSEVPKDKVYKIGLLIIDTFLMILGLISFMYALIYMF